MAIVRLIIMLLALLISAISFIAAHPWMGVAFAFLAAGLILHLLLELVSLLD